MNIASLIQSVIAFVAAIVLTVTAWLNLPPPVAPEVPRPASSTEFPTASTSPQEQIQSRAKEAAPVGGLASDSEPTPAVLSADKTAYQEGVTSEAPVLTDAELNDRVRGALVNILCTTLAGGQFAPISGSGVIIDSRGIILTNAHVGQYFLLRNYWRPDNVTCVVRVGSPAQPRYTAELLYLPQSWIDENASQIKAQVATGTGQYDYAFVRITGTTNPTGTLPSTFPALSFASTPPKVGDRVILAAYPAGLLGGALIATNLFASSAFSTIAHLYSFDGGNQVDVFSIKGSIASQAGSSGGAVVSPDGTLRGIITTATLGATTGESTLYANSIGHISRTLSAEGQGGIEVLLDGDLQAKTANFNATVGKKETQQLEAALNSN